MANNQYVNKVLYNDSTLIDLTGDTVTPESLLSGYTAHDRSGAPINGSVVIPTKISDLQDDVGYLVENDIVNGLTSTATDKPLSAAQGKALNEAIAQSTAIPFSYQATPGTNPFSEGGTGAVLTLTAPNGTIMGYLVLRPQNFVDGSSRPIAMELYKPDWTAAWRVYRD